MTSVSQPDTATDSVQSEFVAVPVAPQSQDSPEARVPPEARGGNKAALQNSQFRKLLIAWVFGNFGDAALFITIAIWVKQMTGSDFHVAMIFVALGLPALIAPLLGVLADRFNRKYLMIINLVVTAAVSLVLLAVRGPQDMWIIYAGVFVYAASGYVTSAAQSGIVAGMLPPIQLPAANGLLGSVDHGLRIIAPLAGAGILAIAGIATVVWVVVGCFLVTAIIFATLKISHVPHVGEREPFVRALMAGFAFVRNHPHLRRATVTLVACIGAAGTLNVLIFTALEHGAKVDPEYLSVVISIQGLGAVAAGLSASSVIAKIGFQRSMAAGTLVAGGAVFFLLTESLGLYLFAAALLGSGMTLMIVSYVSYRQVETPDQLQGRVATAGNILFSVPQTIMSGVTGLIVASVDYKLIAVATAIVCLLAFIPVSFKGNVMPAQS